MRGCAKFSKAVPVQTSHVQAELGTDVPAGVTQGDLYRAAWAASLGSALEYYDFALYNLASSIIFAPLFFPSNDPTVGLMASFGTYFLGFAIRPVGGVVFGILGDRLGRKFVLLATVLLMGIASTLIGVSCQPMTAWAIGRRRCSSDCAFCRGWAQAQNRPGPPC